MDEAILSSEDLEIEALHKRIMVFVEDNYTDCEDGIKEDLGVYLTTYVREIGGIGPYREQLKNKELREKILIDYLAKRDTDYSAPDIARQVLGQLLVPPASDMSEKSLIARINDVFKQPEYKKHVFVKRAQGGTYSKCVRSEIANKIGESPEVRKLLVKQIAKAENKHTGTGDTVGWKKYMLEKATIGESENDKQITEDDSWRLTKLDKMYLMVEAIFGEFFTEFDFDSFEADIDDIEKLDSIRDYGEEYQRLAATFNSPNFNWKYYKRKSEENE